MEGDVGHAGRIPSSFQMVDETDLVTLMAASGYTRASKE